ncbi:DUF302 domain-containing protein [Perlabentimonas gracilis]|uniref:DUF302 domain-containing protein n=1 Tax=Perlabentimonas gracilis TaxID=2715279 RepID=UPI00140B9FB4|nr:DUF302 domain-containing protein [Perlabentimonas gracilis]NHB69782.1 DUF302 domain-containing protein [Perlabentimonas gracilis]
MKKTVLFTSIGLLLGVLITMLLIYASAQSVMLKEQVSMYGFEKSVELFEKSATEQGWSIPTVHDMQKTMDKFGKDVVEAKVFELCHPEHAFEILSRDKERIVMSMMPCRVAIYKKSDGKTYVSWMNTGLMGSMMKCVVPKVMKNASRESEQIISPLIK